ncbi:hypothetical protein MTP03_45500 [Tsukamurella sp. PLM1]|nr:hypothetical protein MTP03_45500 [Tsukamurella sp. PLM1]
MSTFGRILSSHFGSHQAHLPSSIMIDGITTMRTTNASNSTAAARPKPISLMNTCSLSMNEANTEIMMIAAAVTTRAPYCTPVTTDCVASPVCTNSSRIRDTRNTW